MTSQDDATKLMTDMNTTMGYLVPLIESLLKVLSEGDKHALERLMSLKDLLDRIHFTIDRLFLERKALAKAEIAQREAMISFADQQRRLGEALLSLERRLKTSEENAARQETQVLELLTLLR